MISRSIYSYIYEQLLSFPAIALGGPRQIGKTTMALELSKQMPMPTIYLDLERPSDLNKLQDPEFYLNLHADKLIIIDVIQRKPDLFPVLRSVIDENRRQGRKVGQFLLLGVTPGDLLSQSGESLVGRINYVDMSGLTLAEVDGEDMDKLWLRGGFPDSFLAKSNPLSMRWREAMIRTYLEREIPALGSRISRDSLQRFFSMIAYNQGELFNGSRMAASLGVSVPTVSRYLDVFVNQFLVRVLRPWCANYGKRLMKAPKVYVRDSGLLHSLLGILHYEDLLSHPNMGGSWEGFVIENIANCVGQNAKLWYYRTSAGAEVDLVIDYGPSKLIALEIKRSLMPTPTKGFYQSIRDLKPRHSYVVYPGLERYPLSSDIDVIPLKELMAELGAHS